MRCHIEIISPQTKTQQVDHHVAFNFTLSPPASSTFFLFHFISIISHYSYFQFTIVSCLCSFNAVHNENVSIFFQLQCTYLNKNSHKLSTQRITFKYCSARLIRIIIGNRMCLLSFVVKWKGRGRVKLQNEK